MKKSMINPKALLYFFLLVILMIFSYYILLDANGTLGDDWQFLTTTAIGKPSRSWTGGGRFWPLGLVDYSILLLIPYGNTVLAHFIYNIIIMVASVFLFMNKVIKEQYVVNAFFIIILLCASSFIQIHISCIFPERMMFFLLSIFMLCCWKGTKTQLTAYYVFAFLSAMYMTYIKEPIFGALAIIAESNLLFQYRKITLKDKFFNCALLANSAIYVCIYIYRHFFKNSFRGGLYCSTQLLSSYIDAAVYFFNVEHILYLVFFMGVIRAYVILIKSNEYMLLDGLLFAAIGYVCAFILLKLSGNTYLFPSLVLALPSLAYWTSFFFKENKILSTAIITISALSMIHSVNLSKNTVCYILDHRKNDIPDIKELIRQYYGGNEIIFFGEEFALNSHECKW
jgi:hypothetical protein